MQGLRERLADHTLLPLTGEGREGLHNGHVQTHALHVSPVIAQFGVQDERRTTPACISCSLLKTSHALISYPRSGLTEPIVRSSAASGAATRSVEHAPSDALVKGSAGAGSPKASASVMREGLIAGSDSGPRAAPGILDRPVIRAARGCVLLFLSARARVAAPADRRRPHACPATRSCTYGGRAASERPKPSPVAVARHALLIARFVCFLHGAGLS